MLPQVIIVSFWMRTRREFTTRTLRNICTTWSRNDSRRLGFSPDCNVYLMCMCSSLSCLCFQGYQLVDGVDLEKYKLVFHQFNIRYELETAHFAVRNSFQHCVLAGYLGLRIASRFLVNCSSFCRWVTESISSLTTQPTRK
jgi:hypothetical protein